MINLKCTFAVTAGLCSSLAYAQNQPHIILIITGLNTKCGMNEM